ncbi:MAG: PorV/PorQ family protein [Elusimicrobiota bacterium]
MNSNHYFPLPNLRGKGKNIFLNRKPDKNENGLIFLLLVLIIFLTQNVSAGSGTDSAAFLDIPVGAAPAALGNAYTALANDAYAATYNPGGLAFISETQFSAMHLSFLDSIKYEYASFAIPIKSQSNNFGGLGGAIYYLTPGNIPRTDQFGSSTGDFSSRFSAYSLSYGFAFNENGGIGLTGKTLNAKIDDETAQTFVGDIGTFFRILSTWNIGASFNNWGSKLKFIEEKESLPQELRLGTAVRPASFLLMSLETAFPKNEQAQFRGGLQFRINKVFDIQTGYRSDVNKGTTGLTGLSFGAGFHIFNQQINYAWVPYGNLGNTHYFSILVRLRKMRP